MSGHKDDGLIEIILGKDWEGHKAGRKVRVDPQRAAWLREDGYEAKPEEPKDEPEEKPKRRKAGAE